MADMADTAREQARAAALRQDWVGATPASVQWAKETADAASDVWEPLVRDMVDAFMGEFPRTRDADAAQDAALARARKALGEANGTRATDGGPSDG